MRLTPSKTALLLAVLLQLGTTYVIKEGGMEVGRWVDPDGIDAEQIIENDRPAPPPAAAPGTKPAAAPAPSAAPSGDAAAKEADYRAGKRKWDAFGVSRRMKREAVESLASNLGIYRASKYTDFDPTRPGFKLFVLEYQLKTEYWRFYKRVYIDPTDSTVAKVENAEEPRF